MTFGPASSFREFSRTGTTMSRCALVSFSSKGGAPSTNEADPSSPLPVLLPLEKGLGALAFAPDQSIEQPGTLLVPGLSPCGVSRSRSIRAAFSVPLRPVKRDAPHEETAPTVATTAYLPTLSLSREGTRA